MPRDLAKHFATFSNTLGGVIIIGVEEDPATGLPLKWEGVPDDGKLLERANQFAANVTPLPSYSVRTTDEVKGNVFVLISILEGDVPPYYANGDPTPWLRTGNISKPLRQAEREELVRMVEKKNHAVQLRRENLLTAERTFDAALVRAEAKRKQLIQDAVTKGEQPHPEAFPGSGHQTALEEENRRLKRELERTRQERDILKKQCPSSRTASCEVPSRGRVSKGVSCQYAL